MEATRAARAAAGRALRTDIDRRVGRALASGTARAARRRPRGPTGGATAEARRGGSWWSQVAP